MKKFPIFSVIFAAAIALLNVGMVVGCLKAGRPGVAFAALILAIVFLWEAAEISLRHIESAEGVMSRKSL